MYVRVSKYRSLKGQKLKTAYNNLILFIVQRPFIFFYRSTVFRIPVAFPSSDDWLKYRTLFLLAILHNWSQKPFSIERTVPISETLCSEWRTQ